MRNEYSFENAIKNPYISKNEITIDIDNATMDFFEKQSDISGIPCKTLINLYLTDCANNNKTINIQ